MTDKKLENALLQIYDPLLAEAWRRLGNIDDARDIVQTVIMQLWERKEEMQTIQNLGGYAFGMVRNQCRNHLRDKVIRDTILLAMPVENTAPSSDPFGVEALLQPLDPKQRQVITLHDIEGYTCEEIASRIGKTLFAVRKLLTTGHKILRDNGKNR